MKILAFVCAGCAALASALPANALAQPATAQIADSQPWSGKALFSAPVATATLDGQRGGMQGVSSEIQLSGTTASNAATNVVTGTNAISAGAFANMNGLPVVIQNSGANVLIQNAVVLNLQLN